jgi:hypothetical protein
MHPSAKAAGSFVEGMVGAMTVLAAFALVGLLAIVAAVCTALYFFIVYAAPYIVELCDIFTLWLVDIL